MIKSAIQIYQEIKERESEARADEAMDRILESGRRTELQVILRQLPAWKRWYLRKNQPRNYFRVTCTIPPGMQDHPYGWFCKFQIWAKGKLILEYRITADAYHFFTKLEDWNESESEPNYFYYRPQVAPHEA